MLGKQVKSFGAMPSEVHGHIAEFLDREDQVKLASTAKKFSNLRYPELFIDTAVLEKRQHELTNSRLDNENIRPPLFSALQETLARKGRIARLKMYEYEPAVLSCYDEDYHKHQQDHAVFKQILTDFVRNNGEITELQLCFGDNPYMYMPYGGSNANLWLTLDKMESLKVLTAGSKKLAVSLLNLRSLNATLLNNLAIFTNLTSLHLKACHAVDYLSLAKFTALTSLSLIEMLPVAVGSPLAMTERMVPFNYSQGGLQLLVAEEDYKNVVFLNMYTNILFPIDLPQILANFPDLIKLSLRGKFTLDSLDEKFPEGLSEITGDTSIPAEVLDWLLVKAVNLQSLTIKDKDNDEQVFTFSDLKSKIKR